MKCMKCGKRDAEVYFEQSINGKTTKLALCSDCAANGGSLHTELFGGFNFFGDFLDLDGIPDFSLIRDGGRVKKKKCPVCGCTFDDIAREGAVGCADCYRVFESELAPTVKRIHGNAKYMGKRIKKRGAPASDGKADGTGGASDTKSAASDAIGELERLRTALQSAIAAEEYEKAAEYRDKIRALEQEKKEGGENE